MSDQNIVWKPESYPGKDTVGWWGPLESEVETILEAFLTGCWSVCCWEAALQRMSGIFRAVFQQELTIAVFPPRAEALHRHPSGPAAPPLKVSRR